LCASTFCYQCLFALCDEPIVTDDFDQGCPDINASQVQGIWFAFVHEQGLEPVLSAMTDHEKG
jgi:hypothetical protein